MAEEKPRRQAEETKTKGKKFGDTNEGGPPGKHNTITRRGGKKTRIRRKHRAGTAQLKHTSPPDSKTAFTGVKMTRKNA